MNSRISAKIRAKIKVVKLSLCGCLIVLASLGLAISLPPMRVAAQPADPLAGLPTALAWNNDGTVLAVGSSAGLSFFTDRMTPVGTFIDSGADVSALAWSPSGAVIAAARTDGQIRLWDATTGKRIATLRGHIGVINALAWSADGARLASAGDDLSMRIWDVASRQQLTVLNAHRDRVFSVAWQPNGGLIVSAAADNAVFLYETVTWLAQNTTQRHQNQALAVAWSPDSARYASGGRDNQLWVWAQDGQESFGLVGHTDRIVTLAWSSNSQQLITASWDRTMRLWDIAARTNTVLINDLPERFQRLAWSPDLRRYAVIDRDSKLIVGKVNVP